MAESEADKIRNKRLAKLGGGSGASSPAPSSPSVETPSIETPQATSSSASQDKPAEPAGNPFSQLGIKSETKTPVKINITPSAAQKRP
ncbi:hypothetical protein KCU98_g16699, partial [Aureobasidium melanogenum]